MSVSELCIDIPLRFRRYGGTSCILDNINALTNYVGQYEDGTTDVTRTWVSFRYRVLREFGLYIRFAWKHFGSPTDEEKRAFTRVLQGHIAIDSLIFPNGTSGRRFHSYRLIVFT